MVVRDIPMAFATVLTPPRPSVRASIAAHRRSVASSSRSASARYLPAIISLSAIPKSGGLAQIVQLIFARLLSSRHRDGCSALLIVIRGQPSQLPVGSFDL